MTPVNSIRFNSTPDPDEYEETSPQLAQTLRECLASGQEPTVARRTLGGRWIIHVRTQLGDQVHPEEFDQLAARGDGGPSEAEQAAQAQDEEGETP